MIPQKQHSLVINQHRFLFTSLGHHNVADVDSMGVGRHRLQTQPISIADTVTTEAFLRLSEQKFTLRHWGKFTGASMAYIYRMFQEEVYSFESVYKFIRRTFTMF
jgi:hypothetical protein